MPTAAPEKTDAIPLEACRFAATVDLASAGDAKNKPVTIHARTAGPVESWFFGTMVHDMAGMETDGAKIPLDYCHCADEILGFADKWTADNTGLTVLGTLVPFEDDDRASEVIFKAAAGVPYQGSIYFDPFRLVLEQVGAGMTVEVNGTTFTGPGVIARKWVLRGVAICPYGTDSASEVEFAQRYGRTPKHPTALGAHAMSSTAAAPAEPKTDATAPAAGAVAEAPKTEPTAETTATTTTEAQAAAAPAAPAASPTGATNMTAPGQRFLDAFGDQGGTWFAQGKSFEESQTLFAQASKDKIAQLEKDNADLKTQLTALRGEGSPVSFSAELTPEQIKAAQLAAKGTPDNYAKISAGIKLPGPK